MPSNSTFTRTKKKSAPRRRVAPDLPKPAGQTDGDRGVRVLARGLALLRAFRPRNAPLTNSELADLTELPRPTVSRLSATLMKLGYLDYLPEKAQYQLSASVLTLGFGVLSTSDVRLRAHEHMQQFADQEDVLVVLSVPDNLSVVCQAVCRGKGALTVRLEEGSRIALPQTAMGRAWYASLEPSARDAVWDQIKRQYPSTALKSEFDAAAKQMGASGYCITISKVEPDLLGVATVVKLAGAQDSYLLGCAVPAFRFPQARSQERLGAKLMMLRQRIEEDAMISGVRES